jgi:hypothetical protein
MVLPWLPLTATHAEDASTGYRHQIKLEIGVHKRIIACEHCGRVLVDHTIAHPESVEA